ncbi:MAG: molybdate ABC transporter substrate-binding protein [Plesiomonas sp.]
MAMRMKVLAKETQSSHGALRGKCYAGWVGALTVLAVFNLPAASAVTLNVAVAANFKPTLEQLAAQFHAQTGHQVTLSSASSGVLYQQIVNGAPFDLFLSADSERPQRLEQEGRIVPGSRFTYARGQLALWNTGKPVGTDPKQWQGKLAIANPRTAPYGAAAQHWLEQRGAWNMAGLTLVTGSNIAQTYQFVQTGNAPMGLVAYPNVKMAQPQGQVWLLPADAYPAIEQQAVILASSAKPAEAKAFATFLRSEPARSLIESHGYLAQ